MNKYSGVRLVQFDLDGTLIDTAPDMVGALNELRAEHGLAPEAFETVRPMVSKGSRGVMQVGMPRPRSDEELHAWIERFLDLYKARVAQASRPFAGMDALLDVLDAEGRKWAVVTNKPGWLARPLLKSLGLSERACAIVAGDEVGESKPSPLPLLSACEVAGVPPAESLYIGDDERDVRAARAAGMPCVVVAFGYIPEGEDVEQWGADYVAQTPDELIPLLGLNRVDAS